jgi:hypothetical protein
MSRRKRPPEIYQLKITLRGAKPPIWRRVQVPSEFTLAQLHQVIQAAMGWYDGHLHEFDINGQAYGQPMTEIDFVDIKSENALCLNQFVPGEKYKFSYMYDMGDGWEHQILVEKVLPPAPDVRYPVCIKGKRACPPEDCGGIWGYADFLDAIQDAKHPEHEEMLEWVGGEFDPEAFDLDHTNQRLQRIR